MAPSTSPSTSTTDQQQQQDGASAPTTTTTATAPPSPNGIQHMPRKRAVAPGFSANFEPELVARPGPSGSKDGQIIETRERRWGPLFVKVACYGGALAVGYTYINGFMHLYRKNRLGWTQTFRHRLYILSPLMALYACGNGVIPMPFKRTLEGLVGRPALSTMDIYNAKERLAKQAAGTA